MCGQCAHPTSEVGNIHANRNGSTFICHANVARRPVTVTACGLARFRSQCLMASALRGTRLRVWPPLPHPPATYRSPRIGLGRSVARSVAPAGARPRQEVSAAHLVDLRTPPARPVTGSLAQAGAGFSSTVQIKTVAEDRRRWGLTCTVGNPTPFIP